MGYWRRSANLRWRKREARGPLGEIFILNIYPYKKDRNATQCDECENRMAAKKGQGLVRTALNQGYRTLLVLNVPKRLGPSRPRSADQLAKVPSGSPAVGQEKDGKRVRRVLASREDRLEGQIGGDNHTT